MQNLKKICIMILSISFFLISPLVQLPIGAETDVKRSSNVSSPFFFNITLLTPSKYNDRVEWTLLIEEELNNIGIGVDLDFAYELDWQIFPKTPPNESGIIPTYDEGGYDIIIWGDKLGSELEWNADQWYDPCIAPFNYYNSTTMNQLFTEYQSSFEANTRYDILKQIQATFYEDQPEIMIVYPAGIWAFDPSWNISKEDIFAIQTYRMRSGWADFGFDDQDPIVMGRPDLLNGGVSTIAMETPFQRFETGIFTLFPSLIWQGLYERNRTDNFQWVPLIAEKMPERNTNYTSATIKLREDVFFADGHQLTSQDVVESYRFILTPGYASLSNSEWSGYNFTDYFETNESITAIDNFTVQFKFNKAFPYALELFDYGILPIHIWGNHTHPSIPYEEREDILWNNFSKLYEFCIGTGPYRYKSINLTDERVELQAVDNYWKGEVKTKEFHFIQYDYNCDTGYSKEEDQAIADLQSGKTHILERNIIQNLAKIQNLVDVSYYFLPNSNFIIGDMDTPIQYLQVNMHHPILGTGIQTPLGTEEAAKYIRQAISHIIPRQRIIDEILSGMGIPGITRVTPFSLGFDDSLDPYPYDKAKVMTLLKAAGYQYTSDIKSTTSTISSTTSSTEDIPSFELLVVLVSMTQLGIYATINRLRKSHQK